MQRCIKCGGDLKNNPTVTVRDARLNEKGSKYVDLSDKKFDEILKLGYCNLCGSALLHSVIDNI